MDEREQAERRVGERIAGKYHLTRLLGCGGMGAVYEAEHEFTHRRVALKLMHAAFARSRVAAERFLRESRAPSTIGHSGIVDVLDGGFDQDGSLYLVLELLEGETLTDAIAGGLRDERLVEIALELLDALAAAHEAGFVHRDIKPDNVFLAVGGDRPPRVKLLDFGIAGTAAPDRGPSLTVAGAVLGTPMYMSPEQAKGQAVDARSDLWSVGAVLYRALSGRLPYDGKSFNELIVSIATGQHEPIPRLRPDLSLAVTEVVERALCKSPDERWRTATEMATALRSALRTGLRDGPTVAPRVERRRPLDVPPAALSGQRAPAQRMPLWLVGFGAFTLLVFVAAGALMWARRPAEAEGTASLPDPEVLAVDQVQPVDPGPAVAEPAAGAVKPQAKTPGVIAQDPIAAVEPPAPDPAVAPAPTNMGRGLGSEALARAIQANQAGLQRCYQKALLETGSKAAVRLQVSLRVRASGRVSSVQVDGQPLPGMARCIEGEVARWRLPGSDVTSDLSFPAVFEPIVVDVSGAG